jgi:hypothetical protein
MDVGKQGESVMTTQHIKNRLQAGEYDLLLAELRDWQARTKLMYATSAGYISLVEQLKGEANDTLDD